MFSSILRYVLACLVCTLFISICSTQLVLASVENFGLGINLPIRLESTYKDILGFGPTLIMVVAAAYLVGFTMAKILSRWLLDFGQWVFIAGITAVPTAILVMNKVLGLSVLVITNTVTGWIILVIGSVFGSIVFYRSTSHE